MKYNYNSELSEIDTPDKAYLLGLWFADGFVTYDPSKSSYFSGIKLHVKDLELLKKIMKKFPFFVIAFEKNCCTLRCNQRKFCEDLMKNGVYPNKSGVNKDLLKFPEIPYELYSHFIRGYFGGDGSIFFSRVNGGNSKGFVLIGNNYKFLKKIQEILWNEGIKLKITYKRGGESVIRGQKVIFKCLTFSVGSQNSTTIRKASKYLYKNSTLHMERKYIIFNIWIPKPVKTSPRCPKCKSNNTQWQRKGTYIICRNCNKYSNV